MASKTTKEYQAELRQRRISAGLCIICSQPSENKTCDECKKKDSERQKKRQRGLTEQGLCKTCGKEAFLEGHLYCAACLEKANGATRKHRGWCKKDGRCTSCGEVCSTIRCDQCRVKVNASVAELRKERKAQGLCRDCGREAQITDRTGQYHMPGGKKNASYCSDCFLKMTCGYVLGTRKRWRELLEIIEKSGWRCAYTGEKLILGENLSFDHKNPVCRFPEQRHLATNVEPVSLTVNLAKRHMTKEEFMRLVETIYCRSHAEATD